MSTRSRIGVLDSDNRVRSIYCHFDGYPTGVGAMLRDHWRNVGRVEEMIALGDLSSLGRILGSRHSFDSHHGPSYASVLDKSMTDEEWQAAVAAAPYGKGWCNAYGRDRGEPDVDSISHTLGKWPDYGQEWEYLFSPKERSWTVRHVSFKTGRGEWRSLASAIAEDEAEIAAYEAERKAKATS